MRHVVVRYQAKPDQAAENQQLVEKVFEELRRSQPDGISYAVFRLADGVSFVHVAALSTADGSNPLTQSASFGQFQSGIAGRCEEPPVGQEATLVGSYGSFSG